MGSEVPKRMGSSTLRAKISNTFSRRQVTYCKGFDKTSQCRWVSFLQSSGN